MIEVELLKKVVGEDFVSVNSKENRCFVSETTEAIVIEKYKLINLLENYINNEIGFYTNSFLKNFLPEKYHTDALLDDLKEMAKYDHTILTNLLINKSRFYSYVIEHEIKSIKDFILEGSVWKESGNYCIFYAKKED